MIQQSLKISSDRSVTLTRVGCENRQNPRLFSTTLFLPLNTTKNASITYQLPAYQVTTVRHKRHTIGFSTRRVQPLTVLQSNPQKGFQMAEQDHPKRTTYFARIGRVLRESYARFTTRQPPSLEHMQTCVLDNAQQSPGSPSEEEKVLVGTDSPSSDVTLSTQTPDSGRLFPDHWVP